VPTNNRPELFIQKLEQCNVIFDFRDPSIDIRSKEIKRSTLQELLEYISNNRNVIQPVMYPKIVNMVSTRRIVTDYSLRLIYSVQFPLHRILSAMSSIQRRMNQLWKLRGLIFKSSMNSFSDSLSRKISMSLPQSHISTQSLSFRYISRWHY
jgi:hypothetical protein